MQRDIWVVYAVDSPYVAFDTKDAAVAMLDCLRDRGEEGWIALFPLPLYELSGLHPSSAAQFAQADLRARAERRKGGSMVSHA